MNKIILFLVFVLSATTLSVAQSLLVDVVEQPVTVEGYADEGEELVAPIINVTNNTNQTVTMSWERIVNDHPQGWEVLVCDSESCFPPQVNTNNISDIAPGQSIPVNIHFKPHGATGIASVKIRVCIQGDAASCVDLDFQGSAMLLGISSPYPKGTLSIYPNPVRSNMTVSFSTADNVSKVELYNVVGKPMGVYYPIVGSQSSLPIDVSDLSEGMYFVGIYNNKDRLVKTRVFSKVN